MEVDWKRRRRLRWNRQMVTKKPRLLHFSLDRDTGITTNASVIGLGITLRQKQSDSPIRSIAFASRFLNNAEKNNSVRELELLAVVWGFENFRFCLYSKIVCLYTDHQALEPLSKQNRDYRRHSERITRWLSRLAHFDISIHYTAGKNLKLTEYLCRHPTKELPTEENYDQEDFLKTLSEIFILTTNTAGC